MFCGILDKYEIIQYYIGQNNTKLSYLGKGEMYMFENINMLYLAHYAPDENGKCHEFDTLHKVYADYHQKIYDILSNNCSNVKTSNNPQIILNIPDGINYIFSLYNRMPFRNSEIFISSVAEYYKIAYLGARPNIRALAEDKHLSKMMAVYANVTTPKWEIYSISDKIKEPSFKGPYFIKPRFGAASKYIDENSICDTWSDAISRIEYLYAQQQDVIVEQFIDGIYYTSPVLNNFNNFLFLPCIQEISKLKGNIVTYRQKRKVDGGLYREVVDDYSLNTKVQYYSKKMFKLIQPLDYTRFDYIVSKKNNIPYFIEFNVCCNLGEHSTLSQAAKSLGYTYEETILNILASSLYRSGLITNKSHHF